jgi:ribosomal protein L9
MKVRSFYLPQMHNGEHTAYHVESLEQLNRANPALSGVYEQTATYANALNEQKLTIDVFAASEMSPESAKLDKLRDKAYSAFKAYLKVYVNDPDIALSEAAERILFVVRKSAIDVGDPLRLGQVKATTATNSLLRNLEPLRADIEMIKATRRLNALETANHSFENLQIERNIEKAGKHPGSVKDARIATDAAYQAVIERINALALIQGGSVIDTYIKEQNAIIDKYANIVAQRKGWAKKGEELSKDDSQ